MNTRALLVTLASFMAICIGSAASRAQTTLMSESFDDGNLTSAPPWAGFFVPDCITLDSTRCYSPRFSCRISTVSQLSAIEAPTRIFAQSIPFDITERVYVESMGDEAIPILLRGNATVLALFLLPNRVVQLDVLKSTSQWVTAELVVNSGYTLNAWHLFHLSYDGSGVMSLYIDGVLKGSVTQPLVDVPSILQVGNRYIAHTSTFNVDDILMTTPVTLPAPGKVYIILCSDTGTWDGLDVDHHDNAMGFSLFTSPTGNASIVINPAFRNGIRDSRGHPLVLTWFMLNGSMMAYGSNPEVTHPWIANQEMMVKYHGAALQSVGDELALHYHNWIWNDPNGDGTFHWNQSLSFPEYRDDFIETVGHTVTEGGTMPTSFRSGWHYMDNGWEACLDSLIPYRLENTSPGRGIDTVEPLDNIIDWSRATLEWVPYHPDTADYQLPGSMRGWEARCMYMKSVSLSTVLDAFGRAYQGTDQVMTIWSHLPESDFPQQILRVDTLLHLGGEVFPEVEFDYLTATSAMKQWRGVHDDDPPSLACVRDDTPDSTTITITVSEPLWQPAPLVFEALSSGRVVPLAPSRTGNAAWTVSVGLRQPQYEAIGIAATDTAGNSSVTVIPLSPTAVSREQSTPREFRLAPPYPNPFNPKTEIRYQVPDFSNVNLAVYDVLGREVVTLVNETRMPGEYEVGFDGSSVASGVYVCRLTARPLDFATGRASGSGAGIYVESRKMILVK